METPEGKVSLLDAVPVRCDHILTEWEGDYAVISYPRFKYEWMRRLLLPQSMSPDIHVHLGEHGSAVWRLIDGRRTVREIVFQLADHFHPDENYASRVTTDAITKGWIYKITLCQLLIKPLFQDRIIPLLWNSY